MKKYLIAVFALILIFSCVIGCSPAPETDKENIEPTPKIDEVTFEKSTDAEDGHATVYIPSGRNAKVLLLSDPQLDATQKYSIVGSYNDLTIKFLDKLLTAVAPDLVIVTGDIAMTAGINNWNYFCSIADVFEAKEVPWSFTFGNHDDENEYVNKSATTSTSFGQLTKERLISEVQAKYAYCLINSENCSDGYGNHVINVRDQDGKLLNTFFNFDCVYDGDSYSHIITDAQCTWYKDTVDAISKNEGVEVIPSIVTTHVALPEAFISWKEAFTEGTPNEHYCYGQLLEGDYSSYAEDSNFFQTLLDVGSTKAVFFGHHHSNDASTEYKGIRLTFIQHSGMSHDYRTTHSKGYGLLSWPDDTVFDFSMIDTYGDQRGGTMVEISPDTTYTIAPVYAAEVIPNYVEWAIDYDATAQKIIDDRGSNCVIRGK